MITNVSGTRYTSQILMKFEFFSTYFRKTLKIKCHENTFSESLTLPCGRTDGQTYMMKQRVAFHSIVNAPENYCILTPNVSGQRLAPLF
jgi:hypothetical protein